MTNETQLDLTADVIDVRDIIARFEALEADSHTWCDEGDDADAWHDLNTLQAILDELKGNGGDEKWRGDWYPLVLIRDSHFTDYIRELLADCGDVSASLPWYVAVDWGQTARNFHVDYTTIDIDSVKYWYR